ncbi:hypothetical protein GGF32_005834 [Allomyces javanicus]|nr:hypothetical protein GGF32_005834 [Allomyces javanicus]
MAKYLDAPTARADGLEVGYARTVHLFDFDDNVFHMPTPILLFNEEGETFRVSTGAYAVLKVPENRALRQLHNYHVRFPDSLLEFAENPDQDSESFYLRDLKKALGMDGDDADAEPTRSDWKGPLWDQFVDALASDPDNVWIITARLHAPETIHAGLQYLVDLGLLPVAPALDRIWPVANDGFRARFDQEFAPETLPHLPGEPHMHWSTFKAVLMRHLLDRFAHFPEGRTLCKYSDDDAKNVEATCQLVPTVLADLDPVHPIDFQVYSTAQVPLPSVTFFTSEPGIESTRVPFALDFAADTPSAKWATVDLRLNTSNALKLHELTTLLAPQFASVTATVHDVPEPAADPITVIRYKASTAGDGVLCDDTSLEIPAAGADSPSANVKWVLDTLGEHAGERAMFVSMLGVRFDDTVAIYRGEVWGTIVADPCGGERMPFKPGFLPWFVPDGEESGRTLAEIIADGENYDAYNARHMAVQDLLRDKPYVTCAVLEEWTGPFQQE